MHKLKQVLIAAAAAGLAAAGSALAQPASAPLFTNVSPDQIKWRDYPGEYGAWGMKSASVMGDSSKPGLYVERVVMPAHVMSTPHTHPTDRIAYVLKGTYYVGTSATWDPAKTIAVPAGGVIQIPRDAVHFDGARDEDVTVQFVAVGPSGRTAINPADPPFRKSPN